MTKSANDNMMTRSY